MSDIQQPETQRESSFDGERAEAFAGRMMEGLNDGAMCLMASLGHRTGLFDVMSRMAPANNMEHPLGTVLYTVSCMHCMTVSLAQGGEGLGTMWGQETAVEMLEAVGFGDVEVHEFEEDIQNCYFVCSL